MEVRSLPMTFPSSVCDIPSAFPAFNKALESTAGLSVEWPVKVGMADLLLGGVYE